MRKMKSPASFSERRASRRGDSESWSAESAERISGLYVMLFERGMPVCEGSEPHLVCDVERRHGDGGKRVEHQLRRPRTRRHGRRPTAAREQSRRSSV